jgi:hypothetical protein
MYTDTVNTNNQVLKGVITSAVSGLVESFPYQSPLEKENSNALLAALNHVLELLPDAAQLPQQNQRSIQQQPHQTQQPQLYALVPAVQQRDAIAEFELARAQYIHEQSCGDTPQQHIADAVAPYQAIAYGYDDDYHRYISEQGGAYLALKTDY